MALLKLYFAGTGGSALALKQKREEKDPPISHTSDEIIRIYFSGCQDTRIGGKSAFFGYVAPNLDTVSDKLLSCLKKETCLELDLKEVEKLFGESAIIDTSTMPLWNNFQTSKDCHLVYIDEIFMHGYSRGAVTTFILTKKINHFDIPLHCIAEEPVPGDRKLSRCFEYTTDSLLDKSHDLSECHNLVEALILLGQYNDAHEPSTLLKNMSRWFKQMAPIFPANCNAKIYQIPIHRHSGFGIFHEQHAEALFNPEKNTLNSMLRIFLMEKENNNAQETQENYNKIVALFLSLLPKEPSFLPRFSQLEFHFGVMGRLEIAPFVKEMLAFRLKAISGESPPRLLSQVRCMLALYRQSRQFPHLVSHILNKSGTTFFNIALRDFITEMDATLNLFNFQTDNIYEAIIKLLRTKFFSFLEKRLADNDYIWGNLSRLMIEEIKSHAANFSSRHLKILETFFDMLITSAPLQHPQMAYFLEEQDREQIALPCQAASRKPYDAPPENAFELCRQMFFSNNYRRKLLYQQYLKDFEELGVSDLDKLTMATLLNQPTPFEADECDVLSEEGERAEENNGNRVIVNAVLEDMITQLVENDEAHSPKMHSL